MHTWLEPVFDRLARPIFGSWVPFAVDALVERLKSGCALLSPAVRAVVATAASPSVCDRAPAEELMAYEAAVDEALRIVQMERRERREAAFREDEAQASASQHRRDYFDEDEAAALQQAARAAGRRRGPNPLASSSSASTSEESLPGQPQHPPPPQHGGHHQRSVSALGGLLSYASSAVSETATGVRRRLAATTA